jgi:hypothetical protein
MLSSVFSGIVDLYSYQWSDYYKELKEKLYNQAMDWNAHQSGAFLHELFCGIQISLIAV